MTIAPPERTIVLLALATSTGAVIGAAALIAFLSWPEALLSVGTARVALAVAVIVGYLSVCQRRQDQRHRELVRLIRCTQEADDTVADQAQRYLREA